LKTLTGYCLIKYWQAHIPPIFTKTMLQTRLRSLLENGITFFLNLTEEGEKGLESYAPMLQEEADALGLTAEHRRMPIPDFDVTSAEQMKHIIETIDSALAAGHKIYIHCFAGIGRTGTVAGCYLAQHGRSGEEALDELERVKDGTSFEFLSVPITVEQREMVRDWS